MRAKMLYPFLATLSLVLILGTALFSGILHAQPIDSAGLGQPVLVSTYAGSVDGTQDGFRTEATFHSPAGMAMAPDGRLFVVEGEVPSFSSAGPGPHRIRVISPNGIVSTFAGGNQPGLVDGPALSARFRGPTGIVLDQSGNLFVTERINHRIRKIDPNGNVSTFAGSTLGYHDGAGAEAQFNLPWGLCIDKEDNLYVADFGNLVVRKITPQAQVTTYAGIAHVAGSQNGFRSSATFNSPISIAISGQGDILVADWLNGALRKISSAGLVSTVASGWAYSETVAFDSQGAMYGTVLPSTGNHLFLKFDANGNTVWSMDNPAGFQDGPVASAQFDHYSTPLFRPDGNILMIDGTRIRLITLSSSCANAPADLVGWWPGEANASDIVAGHNGTLSGGVSFQPGRVGQAFSFDGLTGRLVIPDSPALNFGPGRSFAIEAWIRVNGSSRKHFLTIFDKRNAPALVDGVPTGGAIGYTLFLLDGQLAAQLAQAPLFAFNAANFISRGPDLRDGLYHHVAVTFERGSAAKGTFFVDGQAISSFDPSSQAGDLSNAEPVRIGHHPTPGVDAFFDGIIDEVSLYGRALSALEIQSIYQAGAAGKCQVPETSPRTAWVTTLAGSGSPAYQDGDGPAAGFNAPHGGWVGPDAAAFIADTLNHVIRRVDVATGRVTTLAGTGTAGDTNGPAALAQFNGPLGTWVNPSDGAVYVADTGNNRIRKISVGNPPQVTTYAGSGERGYLDGPATLARFNYPNSLAMDSGGNLYVSELNNHTVRKITPAGIVSTFIGSGTPGFEDATGTQAGLNQPAGLAIDQNDNLYVTEWGSHRIRKVSPQGVVSTLAGSVFPGYLDAQGGAARFFQPEGIVADDSGALFVTEHGNHTVRHISSDGLVTTVAGTNLAGRVDGSARTARFNAPGGIGIDPVGNLIVADTGNHLVRQIRFLSLPAVIVLPQSPTASIGSQVTLSASVTGSGPLTYQWRFNGTDLPGATDSVLVLSDVQLSHAGTYSVVVANLVGTSESAGVPLTVVTPLEVKRVLPSFYVPGKLLTVRLETVPPSPSSGTDAYAVEEYPPLNWTVAAISDGGVFDATKGSVKFGPFFDQSPRALTYQVIPPPGEIGTKLFRGVISANGQELAVGGPVAVAPAPLHPCDIAPADDRITVNELTAYAAAWRKGQPWSVAPNPIPVDYVTRAGLLWKTGETYTLDPSVNAPPLWWISTAPTPAAVFRTAHLANSPATRLLPAAYVLGEAFTVRLVVGPASNVTVYALEEHVSPDLVISNISDNGEFDAADHIVKWGPFFDSSPRSLSYQAMVQSSDQPLLEFAGVIAVDGASQPITGANALTRAFRLSSFQRLSKGEFGLALGNADGKTYSIEASSDLLQWVPLSLATNLDGLLRFQDSSTANFRQRFFRVSGP